MGGRRFWGCGVATIWFRQALLVSLNLVIATVALLVCGGDLGFELRLGDAPNGTVPVATPTVAPPATAAAISAIGGTASHEPPRVLPISRPQAEASVLPVPEESGLAEVLDGFVDAGLCRIPLEVAQTTQERAQGLGGRAILPEGRGMLFVFPKASLLRFWMLDTLIPLDLVFLDDG